MCHPYRSTIVSNRDRGNKPMVSDVHSDIPPHDDRAGPGLIAAFSFGWKALALRGVVSIILGIVGIIGGGNNFIRKARQYMKEQEAKYKASHPRPAPPETPADHDQP